MDRSTRGDELVTPRIGDGPRIRGAYDYRCRCAIASAVVNDQLRGVRAGSIDDKTRIDRCGVRENRPTAVWNSRQAPAIGQRIAVDVGRLGAFERHRRAGCHSLIGPGVGHGGVIGRGRNAVDALSEGERCPLRIAELQNYRGQRGAGAQAARGQREVDIGQTGGCRAGGVGQVDTRRADAGDHQRHGCEHRSRSDVGELRYRVEGVRRAIGDETAVADSDLTVDRYGRGYRLRNGLRCTQQEWNQGETEQRERSPEFSDRDTRPTHHGDPPLRARGSARSPNLGLLLIWSGSRPCSFVSASLAKTAPEVALPLRSTC